MSTMTPVASSGVLVDELVTRWIDAGPRETAQAPGLWQEFGSGPLDEPGPQTGGSVAGEVRVRGAVGSEWGRSESLDPDDVGDIADEGMGHRG